MTDWKEQYKEKLIAAEEAVDMVKPGDTVRLPMAATPISLCAALARRRGKVKDIYVAQSNPFPAPGVGWWHEPGWDESFHLSTEYPDLLCRPGLDRKTVELRPIEYTLAKKLRDEGIREDTWSPDFFMVPMAPPNKYGYANFGHWVWYSPQYARAAKTVIAEINEWYPWCFGDTMLPVSEIDYFVETTEAPPPPTMRQPMGAEFDETVKNSAQHAVELIKDGDTIQMGVGEVSMAIGSYLFDRQDLGVHSELITREMLDLYEAGVLTGKYNNVDPGLLVGTCAATFDPTYIEMVSGNPIFSIRSVEYTNDIRVISAHDNMVSINSALSMDLTGQVCSETMGTRIYSASGGATSFMMGSMLSRGGRTCVVMQSTARKGTVSRIVPLLESGSVVTIPRSWVDFVATEYGIVNLQGKTLRQRAEAMMSIAHPDFKAELKKEAQKLFWP